MLQQVRMPGTYPEQTSGPYRACLGDLLGLLGTCNAGKELQKRAGRGKCL